MTVSAERDAAPASVEGHQGGITDFTVFSGGRSLATSSAEGTIILWDLQRRTISHQWIAHDGFHRIAGSPIDTRIISMGDSKMKVWGISNEAIEATPIAEHATEHNIVERCFWSLNGEWIAFCGVTHTDQANEANKPDDAKFPIIHVWNAHTMTEHRVFYQNAGSPAQIRDLTGFSPDSRWLVYVVQNQGDPHYSAWDVGTGPDEPPRRVPTKSHSGLGQFRSVSFDPQSKLTVSTHSRLPNGEIDSCVRVWDNDTGELLVVIAGHLGPVARATFSPDGRHILSASWDGTVKVWDAESGACLLTLEGHEAEPPEAIYSPDGCYIATASNDMDIRLWTGDGVRLATFAEHSAKVARLAFSPDGRTLASGDYDGIVHIRDLSGLID